MPNPLDAMLKALSNEMVKTVNEQREKFLQQHIDKAETHTLGNFPWETEVDDGKYINTQLLILVPKGTADAGTREEAMQKYPHVILSYTLNFKP